MMDTTTCRTVVLVLLWVSLCCQALGFLVTLIEAFNAAVLSTTSTLSAVLLGVCLWQCKNAGYLVVPMTWYHWALLVLLVLLQVMVLVLDQLGWNLQYFFSAGSIYPIYGVAVVLVVLLCILGGTLYCGWKCNLFCRPCCKSQYVCYGSAIVVVLVVLIVLVVTASLVQHQRSEAEYYDYEGGIEFLTICYLDKIVVPTTQCYATAVLWKTTLKLPYTIAEVVALIASALAVASMLALAVRPTTMEYLQVPPSTVSYPFLAVHLVSLGITWYCLEYKGIFHWPKDKMCFGLFAITVILVALVEIAIVMTLEMDKSYREEHNGVEYTLLGYSLVLMVPTLWYAYRCGLLTWRWNSCLPKKKGLKGTDTAENTVPETNIAKES